VPNPRFNLLITFQSNPRAQAYLPEEGAAVMQFVKNGGVLVVIGDGLGLPQRGAYEKWGNGKVWRKPWEIWQKLDDRYGTTWYPRWCWVQHARWQDEPNRQLTIDNMIEEMDTP